MAIATIEADQRSDGDGATPSAVGWPSAGQAYFTVAMLAVAVMFAEIDRTAMQLLVQPIKAAYHLSDAWIGALLGPFFALFYALCGVPTSRYIDRHNRKTILAWALGLWSTASVFCGLAQGLAQLAAARLFLGAAESPNGPAIFSIISDSFPRKHLTRGISLMQIGTSTASGLTLLTTGALIAVLIKIPDQHIAGLGVIRWWQLVFIAIGIPGLLAALVLGFTVKEPARHGAPPDRKIGILQAVGYMGQHWKVFGAFMGSSAISGLALGVLSWNAAFYQRTYGWSAAEVGIRTGAVALVATLTGLAIGTWFYERLVKQGHKDAAMRVVLIGRLIALPAGILMPLMPNGWLALAFTGVSFMLLGATGASTNSILQIVSPNRMRGQITAIFFLFYNLVGQGLSPWLIGLATDYILHDESQLRYAILGAQVLFMPASLFVLWLGMKPYRREVEAIEAAEAAVAA